MEELLRKFEIKTSTAAEPTDEQIKALAISGLSLTNPWMN
jgi:hypothetical protein